MMSFVRPMLLAALALHATPMSAQAPLEPRKISPSPEIVVQGRRSQPSNWREAETDHVIVLSDGSETELVRVAHNLERLHFLLSFLLDRVGRVDDTIKLRVTLIGDAADFQAMDLRDLRWQQGPFNEAFAIGRYYDPREDGAVMATTRYDQKIVLERGVSLSMLQGIQVPGLQAETDGGPNLGSAALFSLSSAPTLGVSAANEQSVPVTADSLLYAGFAQHFLLTYFPAAYPRWYLDGFGQLFSTVEVRRDNVIEYGRPLPGALRMLQTFGGYPITKVLNGDYLDGKPGRTRYTPVHPWLLTHYLFFSDARRGQLRQYLRARAAGRREAEAMTAFGDLATLSEEVNRYRRGKRPYERMTYPADRALEPVVRRLSISEAAFVKGRLELGSRIELPVEPAADLPDEQRERLTKARVAALAARDRWLARLRRDAARYGGEVEAQLLLAEAECRVGHGAECEAAASRAVALSPGRVDALAWRGWGQAQQSIAGLPEARATGLAAARRTIAQANRLDTEAVLPLIAYHRSFIDAGETPPAVTIDGLARAVTAVPDAPASRLALGRALAARGDPATARATLRPVTDGPYDSPERPRARALLRSLPPQ